MGEWRLPDGLVGDASLTAPVLHPVLDPEVMGTATAHRTEAPEPAGDTAEHGDGQCFEPADLYAVATALGIDTDERAVAAHYYRELAAPRLVSFDAPPSPPTQGADPG